MTRIGFRSYSKLDGEWVRVGVWEDGELVEVDPERERILESRLRAHERLYGETTAENLMEHYDGPRFFAEELKDE